MNGIWLTWEIQQRNRGISAALKWPLYEIISEKTRIMRYLVSTIKTLKIIAKNRPNIVVAQNPSIVLSVLVIILRKVFKYKSVIDAHNSGLYPAEGRSKFQMKISKWLQKKSNITLVTNEQMSTVVVNNGGRACILPDKIPIIPKAIKPMELSGKIKIAYICTYSEDEPYYEVIKAAKLFSEDTVFYFTGKFQGKLQSIDIPNNVKLMGYLPENDYWSLLITVDLIMDLTLREGCLVCGAYEGIAAQKPLILSNTRAIKSYFSQGVIYVEPEATSITQGVKEAIAQRIGLVTDICSFQSSIEVNWMKQFELFVKELG